MTFEAQKQQIPGAEFGSPAGQIIAGEAESEGTSTLVPRADHGHAFPVTGVPAAGSRLAVDTTGPTTLEWLPGPGAANLAANPPAAGTVYQNGLTVPVAITVGVAVAAGGTASVGVGPANPPAGQTVAAVDSTGTATTFPLTFVVPAGWYWQISGAASIETAQAVTL